MELRARRLVALGGSVLFAAMAVGCSGGGTPESYLAIGDSYSSGEGTGDSEGECGRSPSAYPELVAANLTDSGGLQGSGVDDGSTGAPFVFEACSGAEVADVDAQLDALDGRRFDLMTLTVGGNDVGFAEVLVDCVGADDLVGAIVELDPGRLVDRGCGFDEAEMRSRTSAVEGELRALYKRIVSEHLTDGGTLLVLGYPQLFEDPAQWEPSEGGRCDGISIADVDLLRSGTESLNGAIENAATSVDRVTYVDQVGPFEGHGRCSADPWLNGFKVRPRVLASFHPNEAGHRSSADAVVSNMGS